MPRKAATKAKVTTKFEEPAHHSDHSLSEYDTSTSLTKRSNPYASYDSPDDSPYEKKSIGSEDDGDIESPRTRKIRVQKCYEPLMDNGILYVYNDNPEEYKKARKRIQNRESATRVRYKKKTATEDLMDQVKSLKDESLSLQTQNASLSTENMILKQQIMFYEKVLVSQQKNQQQAPISHTDTFSLMAFSSAEYH
jgi:hypothetical protein